MWVNGRKKKKIKKFPTFLNSERPNTKRELRKYVCIQMRSLIEVVWW